MASAKINIKDFASEIPGGIANGMWEFPVITTHVPSSNKARIWQIIVRAARKVGDIYEFVRIDPIWLTNSLLPEGIVGWSKVNTKYVDSAEFTSTEPTITTSGKNIGKSNQTNAITQALRDALTKYNKQQKNAPVITADVPKYRPMLVQKLSENPLSDADFTADRKSSLSPMMLRICEAYGTDPRGIDIQRKFDGVRVVMYVNGQTVAYSRTLTLYVGFSDVKTAILPLFAAVRKVLTAIAAKVPEFNAGATPHFDGEIYEHGQILQDISGKARRSLDEKLIEGMPYHIYDIFFPEHEDMPYCVRRFILEAAFAHLSTELIKPVETTTISNMDAATTFYNKFLSEKYEGAILRKRWLPYRYSVNNYHSTNLLKMKPTHDAEFKIVNYTGEAKGKSSGALMFILETKQGKTFPVNLGVELPERKRLFAEMSHVVDGKTIFERDYRGRYLTVLYDDISRDGVPLRARTNGIVIRNYE